MSKENEDLKKQYDAKVSEIETIESQYDDLTAEYEALKEQYDVIVEGTAGISTEDVEQAIFVLVNQERVNNGVKLLLFLAMLFMRRWE